MWQHQRHHRLLGNFYVQLKVTLRPLGIDVYSSPDWDDSRGLTRKPSMQGFEEAAANADRIHFNLQSILEFDGISTYSEFANAHDVLGFTAYELDYIRHRPILCGKTSFYENGSKDLTPNPSLNAQICLP